MSDSKSVVGRWACHLFVLAPLLVLVLVITFGKCGAQETGARETGAEEAAGEEGVPQRPNLLFLTADNLGYGDLRCYNADSEIQTPRLDRLARQGCRLTDFYTASPTCTVSRACFLSGRVARRHGLERQLPGLAGNYGVGLRQDEVLISEVMRAAGYATGCFGKWNVGFAPGSRPTERGFDEFVGHASGNIDYYRHVYNGKHDLFRGTEELHAQGTYSSDLFADAAASFIQRHSELGQPWFCYVPFNAPHFPNAKNKAPGQANRWQATDRALAVYGWGRDEADPRRRYAAVVTALDEAIGKVLDAIDLAGVDEQTLVVFFSDNGAFRLGRPGIDIGSNAPLREGGVTCWEGGVRVPALVRWTGQIPAETICETPLWTPDWLIASATLGRAALPGDVVLDGRDPLPALKGVSSEDERSLFFGYRGQEALRMGDYKIIRQGRDKPWELFDLGNDLSESHDLARQKPTRLDELVREYERWQRGFAEGSFRDQAAGR